MFVREMLDQVRLANLACPSDNQRPPIRPVLPIDQLLNDFPLHGCRLPSFRPERLSQGGNSTDFH